ncbi:aspartate/glutamate racemase family protein [Salinisphaera sp. Q1T1-3]|uniref:maleate cis-trans isomerase family protein n=1 Tax=Salinisphaera sp. Q1T1-3 TaxID=2321229 RepID=UPI000E720594|nr:aspartate/glutamate racemase family protein [Salinisphaera sp. Q1T1-3]RJS91134.1 maleate cis-trans isomerase [Salinisphaera sp. Q1T1-3]
MTESPIRVGVLVPSTDTTIEQELPALLGPGCSVHFARMRLPSVTEAGLAVMEDHALEAAALIADIDPSVVAFACTSGSFFRGAAHETALAERLAAVAGCPVVTTARAFAEAGRRRGRAMRLRTPYTQDVTILEQRYLESYDLNVVSSRSLGLSADQAIGRVDAATIAELAAGDDPAEALLLSCTNLPTRHLLADLERRFGLPVVTSNRATAEAVRRRLGIEDE